jgi:hypothetical protein
MTYDPRKVVSSGFPIDDFIYTYNISGAVTQDDLGKALTLDTTAANTMRLAGDGEAVHGRLFSYEDRSQQGGGKVGAVQRRFKDKIPVQVGHGIDVGESVVGAATLGNVKAAVAANNTLCVEVGADFVVVELL